MFKKRLSVVFFICLMSVLFFGCAPQQPKEIVQMTLEELKQYDGKDGRPTYVAIEGDVYDISKVTVTVLVVYVFSRQSFPLLFVIHLFNTMFSSQL